MLMETFLEVETEILQETQPEMLLLLMASGARTSSATEGSFSEGGVICIDIYIYTHPITPI